MRWNTCLNFFGANESSRGSRVRANIEAALPFVPLHFKWTVVCREFEAENSNSSMTSLHWPLAPFHFSGSRSSISVASCRPHWDKHKLFSFFTDKRYHLFTPEWFFFKNLSDIYLAKSILSAHMLDRIVCFYFKPICAGVLNRYLSLQLTGSGGRQI